MSIEWHGERAYGRCRRCGKSVRVNKALFGDLHVCASDCEVAGRHLEVQERRRGWPWRRRTERYCERCSEVVA